MRIGIDISPLESGHSIRGIGFYVQNLKKSILQIDKVNQYEFLKSTNNLKGFDVIHIPYFDPFFIHLPLKKTGKLVVTVHDLTPLILPELFPIGIKGRVKWELNKQLLNRADAIITDSDSSKNDINRLTGISKNKIHTIYLAAGEEFKQISIPQAQIEKLRKKYMLPEDFLLYVGDVTANKNLPALIDAVEKTKYTLVLIGKALVSDSYDRLNPWNKDLVYVQAKIKNNTQFKSLGFVDQDDLVALYNLATASILPSVYEGFGLPVLEAMQSGCPVITTKNGSLAEVAGDAAQFVDPSDSESIIGGINAVMRNEKLQKSLESKGLIQAKKFNWEKTAIQTSLVYKKISL
jgi:glycosyltransferase involved in cell wall biosynthesis